MSARRVQRGLKIPQPPNNESPTEHAESLLMLASTYAGDGALQTAIDRATEALVVIRAEQRRRAALMKAAAGVKQ